MIKNKKTNRSKDVLIDVTEKEHRQQLAQGNDPEFAMKPGRHQFRRGGFRERHPDFDPSKTETKIRVNIYLDGDIVQFFKNRAGVPNAAPYQTQINAALRTFIEQDGGAVSNPATLLDNERFLDSLADRLRDRFAVNRKR